MHSFLFALSMQKPWRDSYFDTVFVCFRVDMYMYIHREIDGWMDGWIDRQIDR